MGLWSEFHKTGIEGIWHVTYKVTMTITTLSFPMTASLSPSLPSNTSIRGTRVTLKNGWLHSLQLKHLDKAEWKKPNAKATNYTDPLTWHSGKVCKDEKQIRGCRGSRGKDLTLEGHTGNRDLVEIFHVLLRWYLSKFTEWDIKKGELCCIYITPQ